MQGYLVIVQTEDDGLLLHHHEVRYVAPVVFSEMMGGSYVVIVFPIPFFGGITDQPATFSQRLTVDYDYDYDYDYENTSATNAPSSSPGVL